MSNDTAAAWLSGQSFNGRLDTEPARPDTPDDEQEWTDDLIDTTQKDQSFFSRHADLESTDRLRRDESSGWLP